MSLQKTFSSMTGHGKAMLQNEKFEIQVEIKSLNNRFREYKWRYPSSLAPLELSARKIFEEYFSRGSFDVSVNVKFLEDQNPGLKLDMQKVQNFIDQFKQITTLGDKKFEMTSFLRPEFMVTTVSESSQKLETTFLQCLTAACENLKMNRQNEGAKILDVLCAQHQKLKTLWEQIKEFQFESLEHKKNKIKSKLEELVKDNIDHQRLAQEFIYFAQKLDIQEEMDRFLIHWQKLSVLLKNDERSRGKELEFMLQELGRETNTLSNKADHTKISHLCVEIKVVLENMREQILNVE